MKKPYTLTQICFLLPTLLLLTSCNNDDAAKETPAHASSNIPAVPPAKNSPVGDPNFIVPRDTVSTQGPHSITRNVLQDRNGNMWLAGWDGIVGYDGKNFTNYTLKMGLQHFHVFSVLEDFAGNLWFGTIGGGVYRFDGQSFKLYTSADGLASNVVFCMLEDKSGNIWLGTDHGASRYDGNTFTNLTTQQGLKGTIVYTMEQDIAGTFWFGTQNGVNRYDGSSFSEFKNKEGASFYQVRSIVEDKNGYIWIGSADGISRFDGKSLSVVSTTPASNFMEDKKGNFWFSGDEVEKDGMTLIRYDGRTFSNIKSDTQIFGITEDKAGNIWFGKVDGVCRYDGKSFVTF
ncbi:MAG TPA: two-component regulator propeller domain-containing protein [Saprospiraceae bacterium]|nr:two-component regulator propeller domain-containing protein [Saprospiraceae bacterium]HPI08405.1 two-component regulator propeller domain-containing protein [Saprospiraceae bacterium]